MFWGLYLQIQQRLLTRSIASAQQRLSLSCAR
jgi:hypothetical protein